MNKRTPPVSLVVPVVGMEGVCPSCWVKWTDYYGRKFPNWKSKLPSNEEWNEAWNGWIDTEFIFR